MLPGDHIRRGREAVAYGHFGRDDLDLPWERLDKVEALRADAGIVEAEAAREGRLPPALVEVCRVRLPHGKRSPMPEWVSLRQRISNNLARKICRGRSIPEVGTAYFPLSTAGRLTERGTLLTIGTP